MPRGYFKGLNFLLNEQPDKAIDAFIEIVKLDPETVELHFALGNLFRRRGETERAIRVHQNLLARPDLPQEHQVHAQYELGQDYLKAGLLDRAEETFNLLVDTHIQRPGAARAAGNLPARKGMDARHRGGARAAGVGRRQPAARNRAVLLRTGAGRTGAYASGRRRWPGWKRRWRPIARTCVPRMLIGDAMLAQGRYRGAPCWSWRRVEQQSVPHVALVAQRLMDGYRAVGRPQEGVNLLEAYLAEASSIDLLEVVFKAVLELDGVDAANRLVSDELRRTPTLLGLDKLLEARLMEARPEVRPELSLVKNLVHGYAQKLARYQCNHCGFKARQFYWQCPGCSQWETYPPRRTEELNVMN